MMSFHFTGTSAGTPWLAMGDPAEHPASFGRGAGSKDILPSLFPEGSRAAATQHTKPLTGVSVGCYSSSLPWIMFILYSFTESHRD